MISAKDREWKFQERIVGWLERQINSESNVSVDVKLPVLANPKFKRQFDVVVETGTKPRVLLTVVEVQKRKARVGRDTINAWHRKMEEVGAHCLLCVSEKGYTSGALDSAHLIGPSVRLLTLAELEHAVAFPEPNISIGEYRTNFRNIFLEEWGGTRYFAGFDFDPFSTRVVLDPNQQEKLNKLLTKWVQHYCATKIRNEGKSLGRIVIDMPQYIYLFGDGFERRGKLNIWFEIDLKDATCSLKNLRYEQRDFGVLKWCRISAYTLPSGDEATFIETFEEFENGRFRVEKREALSLPEVSEDKPAVIFHGTHDEVENAFDGS